MTEQREGKLYLGRAGDIKMSAGGYHHAVVEPILVSTGDCATWAGPVRDAKDVFPERGLAFWHDAPPSLQRGSLWQFMVSEHPFYDGHDRKEAYQVAHAVPVIEVIDLRGRGSESDIRRLLTAHGIDTGPVTPSSRVLVWIADDCWVGPLRLKARGAPAHWIVDAGENLTALDRWRPPTGAVYSLTHNRAMLVLQPPQDIGLRHGCVNWMPDADLAASILKRLRKLDRAAFDGLGVTYAVFDKYLAAIEHAGLLDQALEPVLARGERVREIMVEIERNRTLLEQTVSLLWDNPIVQTELEARRAAAYQQIRTEQQQRVEDELSPLRVDVCRLEKELASRRQQLGELEVAIEAKRQELERRVASFRAELESRLRQLSEAPDQMEQLFAQVAIIRAALAPPPAAIHPQVAEPSGRTPSTLEPVTNSQSVRLLAQPRTTSVSTPEGSGVAGTGGTAAVRVASATDLTRRLNARCDARGVCPFVAQRLHAVFLAGMVPLVSGARAHDLLSAYAATATGGRLLWLPVPSSAYEPQDLLGHADPGTRRIIPHPGGLLQVLSAMEDSPELHLVVLEGVNRAPVESYLLPILASYEDAMRDRTAGAGRAIPLAAVESVDDSDPYFGVVRVFWRRNVLLAAVPTFGTAALPLPSEIWNTAALVDADYRLLGLRPHTLQHPDTPVESGPLTEVSSRRWTEWRQACRNVDLKPLARTLEDLEHRLPRAAVVRDTIVRLYAAARSCDMTHDDAARAVLSLNLLPRFRGSIAALDGQFGPMTNGNGVRDERNSVLNLAKQLAE